jgi:hypothetical protein
LEEELSAQIFQQPLVETENIFEPAVRDATVTLEHCPHLWEQRMEPALGLCSAWCVWIGGCWSTRPDQTTAIVDHRMRIEQGISQVFKRLVIQIELALEQAVRHTPAPLQHGNSLVDDFFKRHDGPFPSPVAPRHASGPLSYQRTLISTIT